MADVSTDGSVVAIIPARGGSKRIPRKNIRPFLGVPLLARTIEILQDVALFDRIVVSTDDDEVATVAVQTGAEVPFRRPAELADDHTPTVPVVAHALQEIAKDAPLATAACCVYPAAVLLDPESLLRARELLDAPATSFVVPVAALPTPIERALRIDADGRCQMTHPEHRTSRTQDLEPAYHDVGQFYWGKTRAWLDQSPIHGDQTRALVIPSCRAQDIDTEEDWVFAEQRFRILTTMET